MNMAMTRVLLTTVTTIVALVIVMVIFVSSSITPIVSAIAQAQAASIPLVSIKAPLEVD
jgi:hypothetical protein